MCKPDNKLIKESTEESIKESIIQKKQNDSINVWMNQWIYQRIDQWMNQWVKYIKNIINAPSSQWMNIGWNNELINETIN